jgi:hypothetical protein
MSQPQGRSGAGWIMSMKNSSKSIGNRTRDLPACSAVTQPTEPPRASGLYVQAIILNLAVSVPSTRLSIFSEVTDVLSPRQWALLIYDASSCACMCITYRHEQICCFYRILRFASIDVTVLWTVISCRLVCGCRSFDRTCCLCLQDTAISRPFCIDPLLGPTTVLAFHDNFGGKLL